MTEALFVILRKKGRTPFGLLSSEGFEEALDASSLCAGEGNRYAFAFLAQNLDANGHRFGRKPNGSTMRAPNKNCYTAEATTRKQWPGLYEILPNQKTGGTVPSKLFGQKKPNAFGLHEMSGTVWEWVWDWKGPYSSQIAKKPVGPKRGSAKVAKGGCWRGGTWGNRVSGRYEHVPSFRSSHLGRLVRMLS